MIIATNVYTVNSENRDTAMAEMMKYSAASRQVEGVINHSYYADIGDPTIIRFYGEFEDMEAVERQHNAPFYKAMKALGVTTSGGFLSTYTPLSK
jgi:quinol monooxygenase YgiN